jgi:hypothetical protein
MSCPACAADIRYTLLTNHRAPTPFFYAESGNHVLLRMRDQARVEGLYTAYGDGPPPLADLADLWVTIVDRAPEAPDGGGFGLWTYLVCPHCGQALTYHDGREDLYRRIHEPKIVLIDGSILVGDDADSTWRIKVRTQDDDADGG